MMLHSTETGVIAGLFRDEARSQERKIPGLSKIPVLGRLFQHDTKTGTKQNCMILVTPTIVPPKHTEEFDRDVEALRESLASSLK
jgi:general secretion pathway protein D